MAKVSSKHEGGHDFSRDNTIKVSKNDIASFILDQCFLTWGKFTPRGKYHIPRVYIH